MVDRGQPGVTRNKQYNRKKENGYPLRLHDSRSTWVGGVDWMVEVCAIGVDPRRGRNLPIIVKPAWVNSTVHISASRPSLGVTRRRRTGVVRPAAPRPWRFVPVHRRFPRIRRMLQPWEKPRARARVDRRRWIAGTGQSPEISWLPWQRSRWGWLRRGRSTIVWSRLILPRHLHTEENFSRSWLALALYAERKKKKGRAGL